MAKTFQLERRQWVPAPLDEVFGFFSDARNLEALTPSWLSFSIVTPDAIEMKAGAGIRYALRWHGIRLLWITEITRWEPPTLFEDVQLSGPYRIWRHTHYFESVSGGTRITDIVHYALPFGWIGRIVHRLAVRGNLEEIFEYRAARIRDLFGSRKEPPGRIA